MAARVALRRAFSAAVAASPSPGLGATASPVGFQHGPLLRRLINSDASAALKNNKVPPLNACSICYYNPNHA